MVGALNGDGAEDVARGGDQCRAHHARHSRRAHLRKSGDDPHGGTRNAALISVAQCIATRQRHLSDHRDELAFEDVTQRRTALGFIHVVRCDEQRDALTCKVKEQIPQISPRNGIAICR